MTIKNRIGLTLLKNTRTINSFIMEDGFNTFDPCVQELADNFEEALTTQRTALREKVEGLPGTRKQVSEDIWTEKDYVLRESVLELLQEET